MAWSSSASSTTLSCLSILKSLNQSKHVMDKHHLVHCHGTNAHPHIQTPQTRTCCLHCPSCSINLRHSLNPPGTPLAIAHEKPLLLLVSCDACMQPATNSGVLIPPSQMTDPPQHDQLLGCIRFLLEVRFRQQRFTALRPGWRYRPWFPLGRQMDGQGRFIRFLALRFIVGALLWHCGLSGHGCQIPRHLNATHCDCSAWSHHIVDGLALSHVLYICMRFIRVVLSSSSISRTAIYLSCEDES